MEVHKSWTPCFFVLIPTLLSTIVTVLNDNENFTNQIVSIFMAFNKRYSVIMQFQRLSVL